MEGRTGSVWMFAMRTYSLFVMICGEMFWRSLDVRNANILWQTANVFGGGGGRAMFAMRTLCEWQQVSWCRDADQSLFAMRTTTRNLIVEDKDVRNANKNEKLDREGGGCSQCEPQCAQIK
ncbi:MAG: hypothetical protein CL932_07505 [Deltaproteobacteria bacterium]|nr:hypothetical protein [Deltaproteobacteria bacterium]